jgi:hypothetical protein
LLTYRVKEKARLERHHLKMQKVEKEDLKNS